jgi:flagellar basal body-associated protein FliL
MRIPVLIAMVILCSTLASAYSITSTGTQGSEPSLYGDVVAFTTSEDAIDADLNGDNDTSDRVVQYYHLRTEKTRSTGIEGKQPSLYGKLLAFSDDARRLVLVNVDDHAANRTSIRGSAPSVFGAKIAFTTSETDVSMDLNGDGDLIDSIVRIHDTDNGKTASTKADGAEPVALKDYFIFSTAESASGTDLNKDGDRDDTVIRYFDRESEDILTTRIEGKTPVGYADTVIVTGPTEFLTLDVKTTTPAGLGVTGKNPSLFDGVLVYDRDGKLFVFGLGTDVEMPLGISGKDPSLFGDNLAFVDDDNKIAILRGEDPDQDGIPDFIDNCKDARNINQSDADKDGLGDSCDKTFDVSNTAQVPAAIAALAAAAETPLSTANASNTTAPLTARAAVAPVAPTTEPSARSALPDAEMTGRAPSKKSNNTYWFLIAVGLGAIVVAALVLPGWLRRRKKSYGF